MFWCKFVFRMSQPESIQYFQFDQDGNMYVYAPGAGFSGQCKLVRPGDDLNFTVEDGNNFEFDSQSDVFMPVSGDTEISPTLSQ